MGKLIKKTFLDTIAQFLIDNGCNLIDIQNPLGICKLGLKKIEEHNRNRFITEVLSGLTPVDTQSLQAERSLHRLYKSLQVISKATTQDKINRFKTLTINGILEQHSLTDEDYELYVRITDELTDSEYIYLYKLTKFIPQEITEYEEFRDLYNKVIEDIKRELNFNDDKILCIRNSLVGRGLLDYVLTYGGNELGKINSMAYSYIKFVEEIGISNNRYNG